MANLEVADILRTYGPAWRQAQHGHLSLGQLKVMSAIERCRSASLGGHVLHCRACGLDQIAYNSCRNRHCPKCQGSAARRWMEARQAELLPVDYYHVVFTLPAAVAALAYQNKDVVYAILFRAAAQTLLTIGADPRHLGCRLGVTLVLHTWGSNLSHHPHVHGIVPGGGISLDGERWVACRKGFFLPVRVLSRLFRRLFLEQLKAAYEQAELQCHGDLDHLTDAAAFADWLKPLRQVEWVVYSKRPFAGPEAVLSYEFIRRFRLHVFPTGFHRIRHYGLFANTCRQANLSKARVLLDAAPSPEGGDVAGTEDDRASSTAVPEDTYLCPDCGAPMVVAEVFARIPWSRAPPGRDRIA